MNMSIATSGLRGLDVEREQCSTTGGCRLLMKVVSSGHAGICAGAADHRERRVVEGRRTDGSDRAVEEHELVKVDAVAARRHHRRLEPPEINPAGVDQPPVRQRRGSNRRHRAWSDAGADDAPVRAIDLPGEE
jgi:hypothetical protein